MSKKEYIIPIFIPFLGCPHDCAFCNQVKITNYKDNINKENTIRQINQYLSYFPKNENLKEIAFFGGSFTGLDEKVMTSYLEIALNYKKKGIIDRIRLSTRPDYINNSILDILKKYEVDVIELGIQSLDNEILNANERGHSKEDSIMASKLIKDYGFKLGHQIMPGLYKDSFDKAIKTGLESIKMNPDMVRIYPTLVIKDTKLEKLYKEGLYKPLSLDEAIEISSRLYMIYSYKKIPVIRIGLQPTENINEKKDVVAGPFHPSIRQLVETNIHKIYLEELINKYRLKNKIKIHISNREISIIAGNKKANKNYFYKKYGLVINFENDENNFIEYEDKKISYDIENFMREFVEKTYGGDLY
ncbi:MAG: radical SAM protein [Anaerococcus vaginalis]|uniref:elongator complex protein 3 n=1 Tax=Anaerococcus vaginalis TaxID=33037 RepID=UPI0018979C8F|nr:radical SAM protein [Anaerococcus vaginalis]MDU4379384.1 radical SAM protein [Anaerococcus vaginalis]MDU5252899.1 radical SAM protein [Anaerococcus vaginalis]MDU6782371.1 radical SAM protein [Anaerococcus vaginalis]MDU7142344.1 radical SAM protein [Anaerococcus vaginalis]MDU7649787.1 radical SAM protein [Anaerococcus vaginalis]